MEEEKVSSWDHDSTAAHHGSALNVIASTTWRIIPFWSVCQCQQLDSRQETQTANWRMREDYCKQERFRLRRTQHQKITRKMFTRQQCNWVPPEWYPVAASMLYCGNEMGRAAIVFACCVWYVVWRGPSGPVMLLFLSESLQRYPSIKLLCNALVWLIGQGFDSHSIYVLNLPSCVRLIS